MVHLSEDNLQARASYLRTLLTDAIGDFSGNRYLAVGTGTGKNIATLSEGYREKHTVDVVKRDPPEVADQFAIGDGTLLPYQDDTFDLITAISVIEHVLPPERRPNLVREMARCTAPGGHIMFQIPNHRFVIELHSGLPFIQWLPWENEIAALLGYDNVGDIHIPSPGRLRDMAVAAGVDVLATEPVVYPREAIPAYQDVYDVLKQCHVFDVMPFGYAVIGRVK